MINGFLALLLVFTYSCASGKRHSASLSKKPSFKNRYVTKILPSTGYKKLDLTIESNESLQYTIFKLDNPKRLIIDLPDTDSSAFTSPIDLGAGLASKVTAKYFPETGSSRIEILLNESVLYKVSRVKDNIIKLTANPLKKSRGGDRSINAGETEITSIELREMSGLGRIIISYEGPKPEFQMLRKREKKRVTLNIYTSKIQRENEKLLTVTAKDSMIDKVAIFQFSTRPKGVVKAIVNLTTYTSSNVFEENGKIILDIGSEAVLANTSQIKEKKKQGSLTLKKRKEAEDYNGKRISLDFQGANIQNILRIIADVSGLNVITSEKVSGKVSLKLQNVPWDLALNIILKNNKLGMTRDGNIIRVATLKEIKEENKEMKITQDAGLDAEALYLKVFQINYESVKRIKDNLSSIKTERGKIDVNERTSTLIVQETRDKLDEMERLIEVLDRRTVQVLIEARIVEVTHSFARELGIRWGGSYAGTTGKNFPYTVGLSGLAGGTSLSSGSNVIDLGVSGAPTAALGVRLGSVAGTANLDMQLLALQNNGKGRILSMPKIATMNNTEALIETGREIPYQTTSSNGTKTEFKKAVLSLKVTPHVAKDNFIRLQIEAKKDEADFANQLPNSPPPLVTKKAKTEVLVKDGDTTVIGGMFKENKVTAGSSVPFLSSIPLIGRLFKSTQESNQGEELLFFITPKTF